MIYEVIGFFNYYGCFRVFLNSIDENSGFIDLTTEFKSVQGQVFSDIIHGGELPDKVLQFSKEFAQKFPRTAYGFNCWFDDRCTFIYDGLQSSMMSMKGSTLWLDNEELSGEHDLFLGNKFFDYFKSIRAI